MDSSKFQTQSAALIQSMNEAKSNEKKNKLKHFFYLDKEGDNEYFVFDNQLLSHQLINYLIDNELVYYLGEKNVHGSKVKAWTSYADDSISQARLAIRKEFDSIGFAKEKLIQTIIVLLLDRYKDYYLRWYLNNKWISVIACGTKDYVVQEGKKWKVLVENINPEFIKSINDLSKDGIINIATNGRITTGKNFVHSCRYDKEYESMTKYL